MLTASLRRSLPLPLRRPPALPAVESIHGTSSAGNSPPAAAASVPAGNNFLPIRLGAAYSTRLGFHSQAGSSIHKAAFDQSGYDVGGGIVAYRLGDDEWRAIMKLGISKEMANAMAHGWNPIMCPIQRAVLTPAIEGRDLHCRTRTGTPGKTLAYAIPIIDKIINLNAILRRIKRIPLALLITPTTDLARQVEQKFHESAPCLETVCLHENTPIGEQVRADICIGTPCRIANLMRRGFLDSSGIQFVVLDELDRMSMLNVDEIEMILQKVTPMRQTMVFSATMTPSWIGKLVGNRLRNPVAIDLVGDDCDEEMDEGQNNNMLDMYACPSEGIHGGLIAYLDSMRDQGSL